MSEPNEKEVNVDRTRIQHAYSMAKEFYRNRDVADGLRSRRDIPWLELLDRVLFYFSGKERKTVTTALIKIIDSDDHMLLKVGAWKKVMFQGHKKINTIYLWIDEKPTLQETQKVVAGAHARQQELMRWNHQICHSEGIPNPGMRTARGVYTCGNSRTCGERSKSDSGFINNPGRVLSRIQGEFRHSVFS